MISKLMLNKHAEKEIEEIIKIKRISVYTNLIS